MVLERLHPSRLLQAVRASTVLALRSVSLVVEGNIPETVIPPFWQQERAELLLQLAQRDARIAELEQESAALRERVAKLEELLRTNSKNSSLPASLDRPDRKPARTEGGRLPDGQKRNQGGQKGHPGRTREPFKAERVDRIVPVPCSGPCNCGGVIVPDDRFKPIQQVELPPIQVLVTEFRLGSGHCQDCGKWHQAPLPEGVVPGLLGPGVLAFIATLVGEFQLSRQSVAVLLEALLGFQVSPATVSAAEIRVSDALADPWLEVKTAVQCSEVVNCDETGGRHKGRRSWLWLGATPSLACFLSSPSRGWPAYSQLMSAAFCGLLCTDRWHTYNRHPKNRRQLCWAHLMRDFQKIAERGGRSAALGTALLDCAKRLFRAWGQFRDGTLSRAGMADELRPVREDTERLLAKGSAFTDGSTTVKTCENILSLREALWAFIDNEGVEPTNNFGERVIRRAVLWRKRSLGTWSQRGERYLERLLTVVTSLRLQRRPVLAWLTEAISSHYKHAPLPSLLLPA